MLSVYTIPEWFFNYAIFLEILFAIITAIVGFYSIKVYKLTNQRQTKLFGIGFLFISFSYFIRAFLIFILLTMASTRLISIIDFTSWLNLTAYAHMIFFLIGLVTLVYTTSNSENSMLYSLILAISILPLAVSQDRLPLFHIIAAVLLIYMTGNYLMNYIEKTNRKNLVVLLAFCFLLLVQIDLIFSLKSGSYYVLGTILTLVAYLLILAKLIRVLQLQNDQKKGKT